ncbi:MAG: RodZ domain-containing protein [Nitrospinales bacterium]
MVKDFGSYLKHERELRGVPLQEIADSTKIPVRFLQALESNDLDELPGDVFIKGYIRSYAKTLGTNADEILATFNESVGRARQEKRQQQLENERQVLYAKQQKRRNIVVGVLVVLLILVLAGYWGRFSSAPPQPASDDSVMELEAPVPEPPPAVSPAVKEQPDPQEVSPPLSEENPQVEPFSESTIEAEPETPPEIKPEKEVESGEPEKNMALDHKDDIIPPVQKIAPAHALRPLALTIQVDQRSWFQLLIDGVRVEDFILPEGTGKTFRGKDSFKITIGNRNGTHLYLNGQELTLPESSETQKNVVRDFLIQADRSR